MKQPSPFASVLLLSIPILFIIQGLEYKFISSTNSWGAAERISVWLLTVFYRFFYAKEGFLYVTELRPFLLVAKRCYHLN